VSPSYDLSSTGKEKMEKKGIDLENSKRDRATPEKERGGTIVRGVNTEVR